MLKTLRQANKTALVMALLTVLNILVTLFSLTRVDFFNSGYAPAIVTFDVNLILNEFINKYKNSGIDIKEINRITDDFTSQLTRHIKNKAVKEGFVILPKQLVIAGQKDITQDIKAEIIRGSA